MRSLGTLAIYLAIMSTATHAGPLRRTDQQAYQLSSRAPPPPEADQPETNVEYQVELDGWSLEDIFGPDPSKYINRFKNTGRAKAD